MPAVQKREGTSGPWSRSAPVIEVRPGQFQITTHPVQGDQALLSARSEIIERALEFADSGAYAGIYQIRRKLISEGYNRAVFEIKGALVEQLIARCDEAIRRPADQT